MKAIKPKMKTSDSKDPLIKAIYDADVAAWKSGEKVSKAKKTKPRTLPEKPQGRRYGRGVMNSTTKAEVRMTTDEKEIFKEKSKAMGFKSLSEFFRALATAA